MVELAIAFLTLTALEIVLGIDNIIFIAIIAGKLPENQQSTARKVGLAAALVTRLMLLASLSYVMSLTKPIFTLPKMPMFEDLQAREISVRDLILILGGLFLIAKSTHEIHDKIEHSDEVSSGGKPRRASFWPVIVNIAIMDIIFSLDSVITAVGMVNKTIPVGGYEVNPLWVMVSAVIVSVIVMLTFANSVSNFVDRHPTLKVLALSFLVLIGVLLTAEGFGQHLNKGYIYFAMAFSVAVEMLNIRIRPKPPQLAGSSSQSNGTDLPLQ